MSEKEMTEVDGVHMKKLSYICIAAGIVSSVVIYVFTGNVWLFINFIIPYAVAAFGIKQCIKKNFLIPLMTILVWASVYNIIYIVSKSMGIIDLYDYKGRIFVQLFIPLFVGLWLQKKYTDRTRINK